MIFFFFFEKFRSLEFFQGIEKIWLMIFFWKIWKSWIFEKKIDWWIFFFWKIWKSWILSRNWKNLIDDFFLKNLEILNFFKELKILIGDFFFFLKQPKKYEPNAPSPKAFFENFLLFFFWKIYKELIFFFFFFIEIWRFVHYQKVKKMKMKME